MNVDLQAAKAYGEALFLAAKSQNCVEQALEETSALMAALVEVPSFQSLLGSPEVSTEDKVELAKRVLGDRFHPLVGNFVLLLLRKNRIEVLEDAKAHFVKLAEKEQGISHAEVTSAVALDDSQREKLHNALQAETGLKLTIDYKVDESLIGGILFQCGDLMIDNTLQSRLSHLRESLMAAQVY